MVHIKTRQDKQNEKEKISVTQLLTELGLLIMSLPGYAGLELHPYFELSYIKTGNRRIF